MLAPHYAEPVERRVIAATVLREGRDMRSAALAALAPGEPFELLDLIGDAAWGVARNHGLVGYLPAAHLARPAE